MKKMEKEYCIPKIRIVQLSDRICLNVGSQDADPNQPAGAKIGYDFPDRLLYEDEDEYEDIY